MQAEFWDKRPRHTDENLQRRGLLLSKTLCLAERGWQIRARTGLAQMAELSPPIRSFCGRELEGLVAGADFDLFEVKTLEKTSAVRWVATKHKEER